MANCFKSSGGTTHRRKYYNTGQYDNKFIVATGGTVTESGDFKIHTFTGDGNFIVDSAGVGTAATNPSIVDYVVVGGGGGGGKGSGSNSGGGGGAGGFRRIFS